jgi:Uma2 family endonuclease
MSGSQFDALPYEEGRRWELLEGALIRVSGPTPRHQRIVTRVLLILERHLEAAGNRGRAYPDTEFALSDRDRLRPHVSVLLPQKARLIDPDVIPVPGAPDIAIEVISPTERALDSHQKVRTYLRNGTREVWQVYPKSQTIQIHLGETSHFLDSSQQLTTSLLPGFASPVADLFE